VQLAAGVIGTEQQCEYLSIVTTMVDHDTPAAPPLPVETSDDPAALHRELAASVPWDVPLRRLPGA